MGPEPAGERYVAHPYAGACRVLGEGVETVGGVAIPVLRLQPIDVRAAVLSIPLSRVPAACLRPIAEGEGCERELGAIASKLALARSRSAKRRWGHISRSKGRAGGITA